MKQFYSWIVDHPKTILTSFLSAAVCCLFLQSLVSVNYDIHDYLPDHAHSTISLDVMQQEYDGGIPNARVMVRDVSIPEALQYKEKIRAVTGVVDVTWLDDAADIEQPLNTIDADTLAVYYKEETALFSVTIEDEYRLSAVSDIREIIGEENAMSGSAVSTAAATTNTVSEIQQIVVIAVLFVLFVLTLTTKTWAEPFIVLAGLGVAIAINSGTNLIFGEISFVTNAAGNILQLAVSLDYSVFLIHRFEECRAVCSDKKTAMIEALCKSTTSILSSGLTTVIGFLALVLMQFQLGPDLGLALAKGVAISLITVFIFMPVFILSTCKWMDKTQHKPFLPNFKKFGVIVRRTALPMTCLFAIIIIPSYFASNSNSYYFGSSRIFGDDTQMGKDTDAIQEIFGQSDTYVLLVPNSDLATQSALSDELHTLPQMAIT